MTAAQLADRLDALTKISESGRNDDGIEGVAIPGVDCYDFDDLMREAAAELRALGGGDTGRFLLQFYPATQYPTEEGDYLLYNQCDGYHFATAYILNGAFDCFMTWDGGVYEPDWYCAWAKLPESHTELFNLFASPGATVEG